MNSAKVSGAGVLADPALMDDALLCCEPPRKAARSAGVGVYSPGVGAISRFRLGNNVDGTSVGVRVGADEGASLGARLEGASVGVTVGVDVGSSVGWWEIATRFAISASARGSPMNARSRNVIGGSVTEAGALAVDPSVGSAVEATVGTSVWPPGFS
jgi:hypothetical protein